MSRRSKLLNIGECFQDVNKLADTVHKDVIIDMALLAYALETNQVHVLERVMNLDELRYDISHTEKNFQMKNEREKIKEDM